MLVLVESFRYYRSISTHNGEEEMDYTGETLADKLLIAGSLVLMAGSLAGMFGALVYQTFF